MRYSKTLDHMLLATLAMTKGKSETAARHLQLASEQSDVVATLKAIERSQEAARTTKPGTKTSLASFLKETAAKKAKKKKAKKSAKASTGTGDTDFDRTIDSITDVTLADLGNDGMDGDLTLDDIEDDILELPIADADEVDMLGGDDDMGEDLDLDLDLDTVAASDEEDDDEEDDDSDEDGEDEGDDEEEEPSKEESSAARKLSLKRRMANLAALQADLKKVSKRK